MKKSAMDIFTVLALTTSAFLAKGATLYWDNNGNADGFGSAGGIWGTEQKWNADSTGASAPAVTDTTASDDLCFGTASNGLATGTITVEGTNQSFRSMCFGKASGVTAFSNGTLNLAAPSSTILVNNASNMIASVLAGTNGLNNTYTPGTRLTCTSFLTSASVTLFPNANLSDCVGVTATMAGGFVNNGPIPAMPYYFSNHRTTATVQMQITNDVYTKCVKIELTQVGTDIAGRAVYAKFVTGFLPGFNFDTGGNPGTIATSKTAEGYGIPQLTLTSGRVLTLAGANTYSGGTIIGGGILEIGGAGQLGSGAYTGAIINDGQFVYNSSANQSFSGALSGTGSLIKESPAKSVSPITYTPFLTTSPTPIVPCASLADCVGAGGMMGGAWISPTQYPAHAYHFTNRSSNATYQLQALHNNITKCVKIELTQSGSDIAARAVYAKYANGNQLGFDFDSGGNSGTVATSYITDGYGAVKTTLDLNSHSKLTLSGTNTYTGGTVVNRGVLEAAATAYALPSIGGITVNNAGELVLKADPLSASNPGGVGNGNPITVNGGGLLTLAGLYNAGYSRPVTLNGGTLNSTVTQNNDNGNYLNALTLLNGARVIGYKFRVGNGSSPSITVSGTNASVVYAGLNLMKNGSLTMTFNVADVTGDPGSDLLIPGVISDYPAYGGMPIIKTGPGTLHLSGANTHTGLLTIAEGTLDVGADNTLNAGNNIALGGGILDMGAFSNAVGTLTVATNSTIILGEGHLAFADSSGETWGARLALSGTLQPQTVRFGTNSAALTGAQVEAITLNGTRVRIKSDGYLAPGLKGSLIRLM